MAVGDLTTLDHVKAWLGINNTNSDALLARLITAASRFVLGYLQRDTLAQEMYNEIYDGYGNNFMMLRQWPVIALESIEYYGVSITQQSTGNPRTQGYIIDASNSVAGGQQRLTLWGYCFPRGKAAIMINYTAGYVTSENDTVPASPGPYAITPQFVWLGDQGVTYSNGTALTPVASNPGVGQYALGKDDNDDTNYNFNAGDQGAGVVIAYSFVPADIEQACFEMVGERMRYKDRIGINSKGLAGQEQVSYSQKDMSDFVETLLQPYKRVVPV